MKSYKNFEVAISNFAPDLMLSHEDALGAMEISMNTGYIEKDDLLKEVDEAFANPYFDWVEFVVRNNIMHENTANPLTNIKAKEYVKSLIWDYLFNSETKPIP